MAISKNVLKRLFWHVDLLCFLTLMRHPPTKALEKLACVIHILSLGKKLLNIDIQYTNIFERFVQVVGLHVFD